MAGQKFYKAGAAARVLGVKPITVRRWCDAGALPVAFKSPGKVGQCYIAADDLNQFARRRTTDAKPKS